MLSGAASAPAYAQDGAGGASLGLGAEAMLTGPGGAALVYDMGQLRIDGILSFVSANGTNIGLGGRALWVVHKGANSDFSLGGGLGFINSDPDGPADSTTDLHVDAIAQVRAFLTDNVAVSTSFGFGVAFNDGEEDNRFGFGAQFVSSAGLVYYFR